MNKRKEKSSVEGIFMHITCRSQLQKRPCTCSYVSLILCQINLPHQINNFIIFKSKTKYQQNLVDSQTRAKRVLPRVGSHQSFLQLSPARAERKKNSRQRLSVRNLSSTRGALGTRMYRFKFDERCACQWELPRAHEGFRPNESESLNSRLNEFSFASVSNWCLPWVPEVYFSLRRVEIDDAPASGGAATRNKRDLKPEILKPETAQEKPLAPRVIDARCNAKPFIWKFWLWMKMNRLRLKFIW